MGGIGGVFAERMVGARGFEPPTSCSRSRRANRAALRPDSISLFYNKLYVTLHVTLQKP
jgi:hypothetical protein